MIFFCLIGVKDHSAHFELGKAAFETDAGLAPEAQDDHTEGSMDEEKGTVEKA